MATLSEQIAKALQAPNTGPSRPRPSRQVAAPWGSLDQPDTVARLRGLLATGIDPDTAQFEPRLQRVSPLERLTGELGFQFAQTPLGRLLGYDEETRMDPMPRFMAASTPDLPNDPLRSGKVLARAAKMGASKAARSRTQEAILSGATKRALTKDTRFNLDVTPSERVGDFPLVSTRVPGGRNLPIAPNSAEVLTTGLKEVYSSPELTQKLADKLRSTNLVTQKQRRLSDRGVIEAAQDTAVQNLQFAARQMPQDELVANAQWYRGGGDIFRKMGAEYGLSPEQAIGVGATQSPQKDWFQNIALAERIARHTRDFNTGKNPIAFTPELFDSYRERVRRGTHKRVKDAIRKGATAEQAAKMYAQSEQELAGRAAHWMNKPWEQLPTHGRAGLLRTYSELTDPSSYIQYAPTGDPLGTVMTTGKSPRPVKLVWQSDSNIGKAISIIDDPSIENISRNLGLEPKVRSFYDNLGVWYDPRFVTADTHAVGVSHLSPFGAKAREVQTALGGGLKNAELGLSGSYPFYSDAYKRAASGFDIDGVPLLPPQMQSVAWDAQKRLFDPASRRNAQLQKETKRIWKDFEAGRLTLPQAQAYIVEAAMNTTKRSTPLLPAPWKVKP